jgi:hypothetical protein
MISFLRLRDHVMHMNGVVISGFRRNVVAVLIGKMFKMLQQLVRML